MTKQFLTTVAVLLLGRAFAQETAILVQPMPLVQPAIIQEVTKYIQEQEKTDTVFAKQGAVLLSLLPNRTFYRPKYTRYHLIHIYKAPNPEYANIHGYTEIAGRLVLITLPILDNGVFATKQFQFPLQLQNLFAKWKLTSSPLTENAVPNNTKPRSFRYYPAIIEDDTKPPVE
ncbi:MAG: hypothetical protein EAY68_08235 [Bacteroidetes bacterium]|nr:MAG: hypothetical protein EAY68_08235 [Bacteroidota bacterium]